MVKNRWVSCNENLSLIEQLSNELQLDFDIVRILVNREINTNEKIKKFLNPNIDDLYSPFLLKDMEKAVSRIQTALTNKEKIAIYGDYDVDGITGVSVLYLYLKSKKANLCYYIPDRVKDGYDVNKNSLSLLKEQGVSLVITVDCGITAIEEALWSKENNMDLIITDHHKCPEILPNCIAVINPKREDQSYPFCELAGVGVAYKLIQALNIENEIPISDEICAITALGTVADIVPLIDENRIFVSCGIHNIRMNQCAGIKALLDVSGIECKNVNSTVLGYQIAPRINAAGRMKNAQKAVRLFISEDMSEINQIANELNKINQLRQEVEKEIFSEVTQMISGSVMDESIIVLAKEGWHSGVLGIVASKITELYYKPCVLVSFTENEGKGSLRSIKGFNIYEALNGVKDSLVKFGGHELAAGITVNKEQFEEFKSKICIFAKNKLHQNNLVKEIHIDSEIKENNMNLEFANKLVSLEPFGIGNPQPNFVAKKVKVICSKDFKEGQHLRLHVNKKDKFIEAIGFSMGNFASSLKNGEEIYIVGNVNINDYKGNKKFQLRIKDIRLG